MRQRRNPKLYVPLVSDGTLANTSDVPGTSTSRGSTSNMTAHASSLLVVSNLVMQPKLPELFVLDTASEGPGQNPTM